MVGSFFDRLFLLPPVKRRRMIGNPLREKLFGPFFSVEKDDTYIFYLVFKSSFVVGMTLSVLLWLSYKFGIHCSIGSFDICIPQEDFIRKFSWSFGVIFPLISIFF